MTEIMDPVTANHVRQAARQLKAEFAGIFSEETIERYIADSLDLLGSSKINVFVPVLAHRFARERLKALAQADHLIAKEQPEVLFVCVHNAGRSQMAAGLVKLRSAGRIHVRSAGSAPGSEINPAVIEAMNELGVDMSEEFPKPLTDEFVQAADVVITMGCGDACPIYPGKKYADWELDDPAGQDLETVRGIRDELDRRVRELIAELLPDDAALRPQADRTHDVMPDRALARRLAAEFVGTFTLVFAGCGAIMVDAKTHAARPRRRRVHLRPRDHGDDLRGRAHLRRPLQPGGHLRLRAQPPLPLAARLRLLGRPAPRRAHRRGAPARLARQHRPRRRHAARPARRASRSSGSSC